MTYPKHQMSEEKFLIPTEQEKQKEQGAQVQSVVPADHLFSQIHLRHKLKLAQTLLKNYASKHFLVFCGRKRDKFLLHKYLLKAGMEADLASETHAENTSEHSSPIIISSDDCQFQNYKGEVSGIIHFDIPQRLSSYVNRINVLGTECANISHAIVTQREVSMLEGFNAQLGIEARSETIPGFEEDDFRPSEY